MADSSSTRQEPLVGGIHHGDELDEDDSSIELRGISVHTTVSQAVETRRSAVEPLGHGAAVESTKL